MRSRRRRRRAPRPRPEDLRVAGNGGVVFRIVVYLSLSLSLSLVGVGSAVLSKHEENIHHEVSPSFLLESDRTRHSLFLRTEKNTKILRERAFQCLFIPSFIVDVVVVVVSEK